MRIFGIKPTIPLLYICLCSVLIGVMVMFFCLISDDLGYAYVYQNSIFHNTSQGISPWLDFFQNHRTEINGRLGDKLIAGYIVAPNWLMALIQTLSSVVMFCAASRLAIGRQWINRRRSIILCSLMILILPWYDGSLMACMFLNYQATLALGLLWLCLFVWPPKCNWITIPLIAILSFCAGSWHEGFSFFILPGVFLIQILRKDKSYISWIAFIFFILGILFIITAPGFWLRLDYDIIDRSLNTPLLLIKGNVALPIPIVTGVIATRHFLLKKRAPYSRNEWLILVLSSILICGTIWLNGRIAPNMFRLWWFSLTFGLISWFIILKNWRINPTFNRIVSWTFAILTLVHLSISVYWQYRLKQEYDTVMTAFVHSPDGIVYFDTHAPEEMSILTLRKPQRDIFMHYVINSTILAHPRDKILDLRPTELTLINNLPLTPISDSKDFYHTPQGNILYCSNLDISKIGYSFITTQNDRGSIETRMAIVHPIHLKSDSTIYYIQPHLHFGESLSQIKRIISITPE